MFPKRRVSFYEYMPAQEDLAKLIKFNIIYLVLPNRVVKENHKPLNRRRVNHKPINRRRTNDKYIICNNFPINDFISLQELRLTAISSEVLPVANLSKLTNLTFVSLDGSECKDFSPLSTLPSLTKLFITSIKIKDISPLSTLTKLKEIKIQKNNRLKDISPLSTLTNLKILKID